MPSELLGQSRNPYLRLKHAFELSPVVFHRFSVKNKVGRDAGRRTQDGAASRKLTALATTTSHARIEETEKQPSDGPRRLRAKFGSELVCVGFPRVCFFFLEVLCSWRRELEAPRAAGDDMATANANAAPGATRPVDQHVEFVVKVILFLPSAQCGSNGPLRKQANDARLLATLARSLVLYLPSCYGSIRASSFAPFSQAVSCLERRALIAPLWGSRSVVLLKPTQADVCLELVQLACACISF